MATQILRRVPNSDEHRLVEVVMNDSNGHLDPRAARALDALVDSGFDSDQVQGEARNDAAAIARLLSCLDSDMPEGAPMLQGPRSKEARLLVDVTAARVMRSRDQALAGSLRTESAGSHLGAADADALDALVETGWDDHVDSAEADRIRELLGLLDAGQTPQDRRGKLIEATLHRLQTEIDEGSSRMRLDAELAAAQHRRPSRWRLREIAAVAAVVLFGSAAFSPLLSPPSDQFNQAGLLGGLPQALRATAQPTAGEPLPQAPVSDMGLPTWEIRFEVDPRPVMPGNLRNSGLQR